MADGFAQREGLGTRCGPVLSHEHRWLRPESCSSPWWATKLLCTTSTLSWACYWQRQQSGGGDPRRPSSALCWITHRRVFIVAVTVLANGIWNPSRIDRREHHVFWGRDGVIEIAPDGAVFWDGLWHSALSDGTNHLLSRNWLMAAIPALAHSGNPEHTLVIGLGTGVTTATLAKLPSVEVVCINHTLKQMLKEFPEGTLNVAENSKINLIWQDGRSGLALNDKTYDIITQQPLYLKQAGSSILLSREYMELVRKRLRPEGIYCVYSNSQGNDRQAMLVRRTVAAVFPYHESLQNGYALIASNDPIQFTRECEVRISRDTPFHEEVRLAEAVGIQHLRHDRQSSPR